MDDNYDDRDDDYYCPILCHVRFTKEINWEKIDVEIKINVNKSFPD